jgi:hypothetical protein
MDLVYFTRLFPLASSFACGVEKWRDSQCWIGNGEEKREKTKEKMSNFSIHQGLKDRMLPT